MIFWVAMVLSPRTNLTWDVYGSAYLPIFADSTDAKWQNAWNTYNPWGYLFDCVKEKYPHVVDAGMGWTFAGFLVRDENTYIATFTAKKYIRKIHRPELRGKSAWSMIEVDGRRLRLCEALRVSAW